MKTDGMPGALVGSLAGAMLGAAMISCFYAGWRIAGLPFVPFDVFDWLTRVLPGRVIAFGINAMVSIIYGFHLGPTAKLAKATEQGMGIVGLFIALAVAGAVLFIILRALRGRHSIILGLLFGGLLAVPIMFISHSTGRTSTTLPSIGMLWTLAVFLAWGRALGWVFNRLNTLPTVPESVERETATEDYVARINRRQFIIRLAGVSATITVSGVVVGSLLEGSEERMPPNGMRWSKTHPLPNAESPVIPAPGTRLEFTPLEDHYRIDINTMPPSIDGQSWRLKVSGLVEKPLVLTIDDLGRYEPTHQFITISCISNPVGGDLIGTTRWTGVSLKRLVPDLHLKPEATHLKIKSADDFWEVVSLADIISDERIMLTYDWDGVPLLREHGYPLRIYIPDRYGMKQPKWIKSIEAISRWEEGYWVVRGWDRIARMKATSVIDTVAVGSKTIGANGVTLVPVGGIAHAGAKGISKVEVKVDDGPWQPAELRKPLSHLTWVIWRYNFPFEAGEHKFTVRCYEGDGKPQIETPAPPDPSGATGLYSKNATL